MNDGRKLEVGDIISTARGEFEVVTVGYKEQEDNTKYDFTYTVRDAKEVQDERDAAAEVLATLESQKSEGEA